MTMKKSVWRAYWSIHVAENGSGRHWFALNYSRSTRIELGAHANYASAEKHLCKLHEQGEVYSNPPANGW